MPSRAPLSWGLFTLLTATTLGRATVALAAPPGDGEHWPRHQSCQAWLQPFDPTLLAPRLVTQAEYQDLADGDVAGKVFLHVREAWLLTRFLALGAQVEVPLNWAEQAGNEFSGLGDLESRVGVVGRLAPGLRMGLAMNARFDTATEPALGGGALELRSVLAMRWDATAFLNLGLQPEYSFTPTSEGAGEIESFQLKLPMTIKLNESWSVFASYQPKWNLAAGDTRRDLLEINTTVLLGSKRKYALTLGVETPLTADSLDWKGYLGVQWFFR